MSKIIGCSVRLNEVYEKKDGTYGRINSIECFCEVTDRREHVIGANVQKFVLNPKDIGSIFGVADSLIYTPVSSDDGEDYFNFHTDYVKNLLKRIINKDCIMQSTSTTFNNITRNIITEIYFKEPLQLKDSEKRKE